MIKRIKRGKFGMKIKMAGFLLLILALTACSGGGDAITNAITATPVITRTPTALPTATSTGPVSFPKIDRHPDAAVYASGSLKALPVYNPGYIVNPDEYWQIDLRNKDLSVLDLTKSLNDLLYAVFNSHTVWPLPPKLPRGFNPDQVMELGKNPGLGVSSLHAQGITGKGVGIAIIDQPLLVEHQEYASQLRLYEELDDVDNFLPAGMHGTAVASIAVGKTTGVAPEADLYFIATLYGTPGGTITFNFSYGARAIRRILQINQQLPEDRKIRVISISASLTPDDVGYIEMTAAIKEAQAAGMLVIYASSTDANAVGIYDTLGRSPLDEPDLFTALTRSWLAQYALKLHGKNNTPGGHVMVVTDSRTTASPTGPGDYVFYRIGNESWAVPYLAGVYALAVQVDAQISPAQFWELAQRTGRTLQIVTPDGSEETLDPLLDPVAIIAALKK
jgi:subtilisin family serine protease